jgi:glycosyltransferase involved in cell wall biosynthesis
VVSPALSVVLPAHNEAQFLDDTLTTIVAGLRVRSLAFEVFVVENGSTDTTADVARAFAAAAPEVHVQSRALADYGESLRSGLLAAGGDLVAMFDVDYYDLSFLDRAMACFEDDPALVVVLGSKRAPGAGDHRPLVRRLVTAAFAGILRVGFGLTVSDTHGMKVLRRGPIEPIARACRSGTDLFDTELVIRADRAGLRVAELPVEVRELRPSRTPLLRRAARSAVGLVRLRITLFREDA